MSKKTRILFFTDIHFGIHANSQKYLDICKNTMTWIRDVAKQRNVDAVLFGGDYFDSRSSIDVKTMNIATESLYMLANEGFPVSMILGNHDLYLRDSTSIHSLIAYGGHKNVRIVDKPIFCDNSVLILPWEYNGLEQLKGVDIKNIKYVFCHNNFPKTFFFNYGRGKTVVKSKKSDTNTSSSFLEEFGLSDELMNGIIKNGGKIISGHIHQNQTIPLGNKSELIIAGSPYETEYGFGDVKCGVYIIDIDSDTVEFVENPYNVRHIEVKTSNSSHDLNKEFIEGAFVRLKVDTHESFENITKMQHTIANCNPYHIFNTIFDFASCPFGGRRNVEENPLQSLNAKTVSSKLDYILAAIDKADFNEFSYFDAESNTIHVDKNVIKTIATEICEKAGAR